VCHIFPVGPTYIEVGSPRRKETLLPVIMRDSETHKTVKMIAWSSVSSLVIVNIVTWPYFYVPEGLFLLVVSAAIVYSLLCCMLRQKGSFSCEIAAGLWLSYALMCVVEAIFSAHALIQSVR
jgi:hypothetical protein